MIHAAAVKQNLALLRLMAVPDLIDVAYAVIDESSRDYQTMRHRLLSLDQKVTDLYDYPVKMREMLVIEIAHMVGVEQ